MFKIITNLDTGMMQFKYTSVDSPPKELSLYLTYTSDHLLILESLIYMSKHFPIKDHVILSLANMYIINSGIEEEKILKILKEYNSQ